MKYLQTLINARLDGLINLFLILAWIPSVHAQDTWIRSMGNGYNGFQESGHATTFLPDGSVLTAGVFVDTVDFDPGPGIFELGNSSTQNGAFYFQRLDASGNFLWAGATTSGLNMSVQQLKTDVAGNVYVLGSFRGNVDFDPGPGQFLINSANTYGNAVGFVMKLNPDMEFVWAKKFGAPPTVPILNFGTDFAITSSGEVYVYGHYGNTMEFDNQTLNGVNGRNLFLARLSASGLLLWLKGVGYATNYLYSGELMLAPNGDLLCTGRFNGTPDFDPGPAVVDSVSSNNVSADMFLLRLTADGAYVEAHGYGGPDNEFAYLAGTDAAGNIYLAGHFFVSAVLGQQDTFYAPGQEKRMFVQKLNPTGEPLWGVAFGTNDCELHTLEVTPNGGFYLGGIFKGTMEAGLRDSSYLLTSTGSFRDAYLIRGDADGHLLWATAFGISFDFDWVNDVAVRPDGYFLVTGTMGNAPAFDLGNFTFHINTAFNFIGSFVLKGFDCVPQTQEISLTSCLPVMLNGQTYDSTGIYQQLHQTAFGCDSLLTLHLEIFSADTISIVDTFCTAYELDGMAYTESGNYVQSVLSQEGCETVHQLALTIILPQIELSEDVFTATAPGASQFQWINCATGEPISGATGPTWMPGASGLYAVQAGTESCMATSACMEYMVSGTQETLANPIKVTPNPFHTYLEIQAGHPMPGASLTLTDIMGKAVLSQAADFTNTVQLRPVCAPGIYFLSLRSNGHLIKTMKVVRM